MAIGYEHEPVLALVGDQDPQMTSLVRERLCPPILIRSGV
jgi:hypothetical protein